MFDAHVLVIEAAHSVQSLKTNNQIIPVSLLLMSDDGVSFTDTYQTGLTRGPFLLAWLNFNPSMGKQSRAW